jgi:hypothetical protein
MNYILKLDKPLDGIQQIKVYEPHMNDENTVSFLVILDGQYAIFELHENGEWGDCGTTLSFTPEIKAFVKKKIEVNYM